MDRVSFRALSEKARGSRKQTRQSFKTGMKEAAEENHTLFSAYPSVSVV